MTSQVLDLQDIKLRHLEGLMPKMQAVVLSKLLYFMKHDEYAMQIDGEIYIKKRMTEWIKLIEIHFLNGTD